MVQVGRSAVETAEAPKVAAMAMAADVMEAAERVETLAEVELGGGRGMAAAVAAVAALPVALVAQGSVEAHMIRHRR